MIQDNISNKKIIKSHIQGIWQKLFRNKKTIENTRFCHNFVILQGKDLRSILFQTSTSFLDLSSVKNW